MRSKFKILTLGVIAAIGFSTCTDKPPSNDNARVNSLYAPAADTQWTGPKVISKGGIYRDLYIKTTGSEPAIFVQTYDSVILVNVVVQAAGTHIKMFGGTRVGIYNSTFTGIPGSVQLGRVVDNYQPTSFSFVNNTVNHTGGILLDHQEGNRSAWVLIENNVILNTDKRKPDGSEGEHRAAILFNTVPNLRGKISGNYFLNELDKGWIEDNINFNASGGATLENPFIISGNLIFGAYPSPYDYNTSRGTNYTGSGITVEGDSRYNSQYNDVAKFIRIEDNVVLNTMNGGINVNAGHDIFVERNRVICSGVAPNGKFSKSFWAGMSKWNGGRLSTSVFHNIFFRNNTVGYYREGVNVGGSNRQDVSFVSFDSTDIKLSENISLLNPITPELEEKERNEWLTAFAKSGKELGNGYIVASTVIPGPVVPVDVPGAVRVGTTVNGTITPVDSTNKAVSWKPGSVTIKGDTYTKIVRDSANELKFKLTGLKIGTGKITVGATGVSGKVVTKTISVNVLGIYEPLTGLLINFN